MNHNHTLLLMNGISIHAECITAPFTSFVKWFSISAVAVNNIQGQGHVLYMVRFFALSFNVL